MWASDDAGVSDEADIFYETEESEAEVQTAQGFHKNMSAESTCTKGDWNAAGLPADLATLQHIHEASLLQVLSHRYRNGHIFTSMGPVILSINPWQPIPHLFTYDACSSYADEGALLCAPPHIFVVAERARRRLASWRASQCIVMSGESGSGKTEACKRVMQHLTLTGGNHDLHKKLVAADTLLEAFGNAQTTINPNSSRFSKYVSLKYEHCGKISGAWIQAYLIDKSRITRVPQAERRFHIFHHLAAAFAESDDMISALALSDDASQVLAEDVEEGDLQAWAATLQAMGTIGVQNYEVMRIVTVLAAVKILCALSFGDYQDGHGTTVRVRAQCKGLCNDAAKLLGWSEANVHSDAGSKANTHAGGSHLERCLCSRRVLEVHGAADLVLPATCVGDAQASRDALATALYVSLFDWMAARVNKSLHCQSHHEQGKNTAINILDTLGFENTQNNSWEQLCSNYASDKLQQQFVTFMLTEQQEQCIKEGIMWPEIDYHEDCAHMQESQVRCKGIFSTILQEVQVGNSCDEMLVHKLCSQGHASLAPSLAQRASFTVVHHTGSVTYDGQDFLRKARDASVSRNTGFLMRCCQSPLVASLVMTKQCEDKNVVKTFGMKAVTLTPYDEASVPDFASELTTVLQQLETCELHFVKCFNPNLDKTAGVFVGTHMAAQLRAHGLVQASLAFRSGYPIRYTLRHFVAHFNVILLGDGAVPVGHALRRAQLCDRERVQLLLTHAAIAAADHHVGTTKVFVRQTAADLLEGMRTHVLSACATVLQAHARRAYSRASEAKQQWAARVIQRTMKRAGMVLWEMREAEWAKSVRAGMLISQRMRAAPYRMAYHNLWCAAAVLQSAWRDVVKARSLKEQAWADYMVDQLSQDVDCAIENIGEILEAALWGMERREAERERILMKALKEGGEGERRMEEMRLRFHTMQKEIERLKVAAAEADERRDTAERSTREAIKKKEEAERMAAEAQREAFAAARTRDDARSACAQEQRARQSAEKARDEAEKRADRADRAATEALDDVDATAKAKQDADRRLERAERVASDVLRKLDVAQMAHEEAEARAKRSMDDVLRKLGLEERAREAAEERADKMEDAMLRKVDAAERARQVAEEAASRADRECLEANRRRLEAEVRLEEAQKGDLEAAKRGQMMERQLQWERQRAEEAERVCQQLKVKLESAERCRFKTTAAYQEQGLSVEDVRMEMRKQKAKGVGSCKFDGPDGAEVMVRKGERWVVYQDPLQYEDEFEQTHVVPTIEKTLGILARSSESPLGSDSNYGKENGHSNLSMGSERRAAERARSTGGTTRVRDVVGDDPAWSSNRCTEAATAATCKRASQGRLSQQQNWGRGDSVDAGDCDEEHLQVVQPRRVIRESGKSGDGLLRVQCIHLND